MKIQYNRKVDVARKFLLILVLKFLLVLMIVPMIHNAYPHLYNINHFPDGYDRIAVNLIDGRGYRFYPETAETLMRPPGYVLILAGIFSLFGKNLVAVKIANLFLGIATSYVMMLICKKYVKNNISLWVAPSLFLFHPAIIFSESRGGVESLFTFLIILFIFFLYKAIESHKYRDYLITGGIFGLVLLVKNTPLLFMILLLPYLLLVKHKGKVSRSVLVNVALMATAMFLVLMPWIVRNYLVTSKIVPLITMKGSAAYQGLYVNKNLFSTKEHGELLSEAARKQNLIATELGLSFKKGFFQHFYSSKDEVVFDTYLFNTVMQEYIESPLLLVKCSLLNFFRFWFQGKCARATLMNTLLILPILGFVLIGAYRERKNSLSITPILLFVLAFVSVHLPIIAVARYHVPLIPFLAILATVAFHGKGNTVSRRK